MAFPPKPKKSALTSLASAFGKGGGADEAEADAAPEAPASGLEVSEYGAAFDAFANAIGIPEDKKAAAQAALKQVVSACMRDGGDEE